MKTFLLILAIVLYCAIDLYTQEKSNDSKKES